MTNEFYEALNNSGLIPKNIESPLKMTQNEYTETIRERMIEVLSLDSPRERYHPEEKMKRLSELRKYQQMTSEEIIKYEDQKNKKRQRDLELFLQRKKEAEERSKDISWTFGNLAA